VKSGTKLFDGVQYPSYIADILNTGQSFLQEECPEEKPDPCFDVCPNFQVKLGDLGNACWLVCLWL